MVVDEEENVIQETAYYPYGGIIAGLSTKTNYNYRLGPVVNLYGVYDTNENYNNGQIYKNEMIRDQRSNGISFIPIFGTGWSLGFEPGMKCGPSTWYGKNDYKWFE